MHFISEKLKSSLYQETQNAKFNLLINANIQNHVSHQQKQTQKPNQSSKKVCQNSLIPLCRFTNIKQHTMELNIESKLNELKKRSYSQKKLMTQTNLEEAKLLQINSKDKNRKRLISASQSSNLRNTELNKNLLIEKQKISSKASFKGSFFGKGSKQQLKNEKDDKKNQYNQSSKIGLFQSLAINLQEKKSNSKLKFVTQIKSERLISFALDPSLNKQALQSKVMNLTEKKLQIQLGLISTNKQGIQHKTLTHKQLMTSIDNTLTLFAKNGSFIESVDYNQFLAIIEGKKSQNFVFSQNLQSHLNNITKFVRKYNVSSSIQVCKILDFQKQKVISNWEILIFFQNWKAILQQAKTDHIKMVGVNFYYPDKKKGINLAANVIINFFSSIKERKQSKKMASLMYKVLKIQRYWRRALVVKKFRQSIISKAQQKLQQCQKIQQRLIQKYQMIKTSRKVEVHIGSLSFEQFKRITIESKSHFQITQISRIFKALQIPDTFIIYVTPFQLSEGVIKYYQRLFKIATGSDLIIKERVYFIFPQNTEKIAKICELSTLNFLLCSPKALKRIKTLIKTISSVESSFIVPSYPSIEYINLSYELRIPIFSSSMPLSKFYSTKIGYRQIIQPIIEKQKLNPPFLLLKSVSSIFSEKQLINTLALLIYKNQQTKRWYLKIDDEFGSRGLAYFNINSINLLKKLNNQSNQDVLSDMCGSEKQIIQLVADELKQKLKTKLKILHKSIYPNYQQFLTHFLTRGGIIQAAPSISSSEINQVSISFLIEPNGDFQILGSFNKLELNSKSVCQAVEYPAKKCQKLDIQKIVRHLYRRIYLKMKSFGYYTIDLLVHNKKQDKIIPYVIGLSCFLTAQTCGIFLIRQLAKVRYDKDTNSFLKIQTANNQTEFQSLQSSKINKIEFQNQEISLSNQNEQNPKPLPIPANSNSKTETVGMKKISFVYCPKIVLPGLESMAEFFRKCKFENIAFDLKTLVGTMFIPLDELECQNIGFLVCGKNQLSMNLELLKMIEFLSKNFRKNLKGKEKKHISKRQVDEVGMMRGVLLAEIHKSEEHKKAQKQTLSQMNCEATFNNLQSL